jgi:DNA (cytosine-5)-methyltransferase 1
MMPTCVDLFSGMGGFSTAARLAGCEVLWAGNHNPDAVKWHAENHPEAEHICQDLHQARWEDVPAHDLLLASPCCQGHSRARGKANGNPEHDSSRSTAWAVVSALEYHRPKLSLVENVPEFLQWALYPAWKMALEALGYAVSPHISDAADHGVAQNRVRMFIVLTRSVKPLVLSFDKKPTKAAGDLIDWGWERWSPVFKEGRSEATIARWKSGRGRHGDRFVMPFYSSGSGLTGRSVERPIGTLTTKDRWAVVDGDRMRILNKFESRDLMSFPKETKLPDSHKLAIHLLGNAVCPEQGAGFIDALMKAA